MALFDNTIIGYLSNYIAFIWCLVHFQHLLILFYVGLLLKLIRVVQPFRRSAEFWVEPRNALLREISIFSAKFHRIFVNIKKATGLPQRTSSSAMAERPRVWYKNICSASFSFVTIHACDRQTDGQTDRITTPKTALTYARAVKMVRPEKTKM